MAARRAVSPLAFGLAALLALLQLQLQLKLAAALQVTPSSPCSSICLDSSRGDRSNSSATEPEDIACKDREFETTSEGRRFQECVSCLQDSDFAEDGQSDQQWFIYNLRYAFDYCVLGFPNSTELESSPCMTSESCGHLETALTDRLLEPETAEPFGFCKEGRKSILSDYQDTCHACVQAGSSQAYLSNFLVAIRTGCEQQPLPGIVIGLNETVFTTNSIKAVNPASAADANNGLALSAPVIAGISIGGFALVLLIAGCAYMQIRKRRNRRARARRASPLSFRCQTHVTPKTADFPGGHDDNDDDDDGSSGAEAGPMEERRYVDPAAALNSNPVAGPGKLASIVTAVPAPPRSFHSPRSGYPSPENNYTTPTSTTSTHSNAPLLASSGQRPYQPSEYGHQGSAVPGLAISSLNATPYSSSSSSSSQRPFSYETDGQRIRAAGQESPWERQPVSYPARDLMAKRGSPTMGGSVRMASIQTSFPPPPTSSRKR